MAVPVALTIAGSDSGGGAGIQADLKTFSALGVYGASAITAITAQNTMSVEAVSEVDPGMLASQVQAVLEDIQVKAVKIGMVASPEIILSVAGSLQGFAGPIVLDPVMVAKTGARLLQENAVDALIDTLLPIADVITPNLPEAARLLRTDVAEDDDEMEEQGRELLKLMHGAVLVKGGHAEAGDCTDVLVERDGTASRFTATRSSTRNTHGTGCTFSAAIAAGLAKQQTLRDAVENGHGFLQEAIRAADTLEIGSGRGPVHHFAGVWNRHD